MALAFTFQSKCTSDVILVCVTSCRVRLRDTSTVYIELSYLYYMLGSKLGAAHSTCELRAANADSADCF